MRVSAAPVVAALSLLLSPLSLSQAQDRPIVAVFQVEDKSGKLSAKAIDQLTDYLGSLLGSRGYRVVPRSQLRERLVEAKKGSFKECFDQSCQIEIGKELAAQKSLASQVLKIGAKCKILVNLFDLKQAASDGSGTATSECTEDGVVVALEQAVEAMLSGGAAVGVDLPGPGSTAPATDDKKAYRKELEKAWAGLAGVVRKLGPQEQLERYQAFLAEYPVDNPYTAKVQKAVEGLEVRLDKEAEAKRNSEEKAAALETERQRAAELKKAYDDLKALTGPAAEQLDAWKKFLADYPDRNPYLSTAKRKMADLEAQAKKEIGKVVAEVKNGMARIPAGEFLMGCSPGDKECYQVERPLHKVFVSEFWIDQHEVTTAEYRKCVQAGSCQEPKCVVGCNFQKPDDERYPVETVDWDQARSYCLWAGKRLPTEAEWEKAARAGTTGARYGELDQVAWYQGNAGKATHPVGMKLPNAYGLYDMLGNVWEWCADGFGADYYKDSPSRDPGGPGDGESRVLRGGSTFNDSRSERASCRAPYGHGDKESSNGFRCAASTAPGAVQADAGKKPEGGGKSPAGALEWLFSRPAGIEFTKTEVTVAQYRACLEAGRCSAPNTGGDCNWSVAGRDHHPVNCVDWNQATAFCAWASGRLPTEQEWYAEASDGGKRQFPWGDQEVSCERAIWSQGGYGCGKGSTWPVCSKPAGNSVNGLCDMSGNVWEWTSSVEGAARVVRGGSWNFVNPDYLRASDRGWNDPASRFAYFGFRCARPMKP